MAEVVAVLAQVREVAVEGGDHFFEGIETAGAGGFGELHFVQALTQLALARLKLSGAGTEAGVLSFCRNDRADEDLGRQGERSLGVLRNRCGVNFEHVVMLGGERGEGVLEGGEFGPDLANEAFSARIAGGHLAAHAWSGAGSKEFVPCAGVRVDRGCRRGGKGERFGRGDLSFGRDRGERRRLLSSQWKSHQWPPFTNPLPEYTPGFRCSVGRICERYRD